LAKVKIRMVGKDYEHLSALGVSCN